MDREDWKLALCWIIPLALLISGVIWLQASGPCWVFKMDAYKDVPARCVKELTK